MANRLLRRARDYAEVRAGGNVDGATAAAAMQLYKVHANGWTEWTGACWAC